MAYEKIEQYKKQLIEIVQRPKQAGGNPVTGTNEDLQELAQKVGASTRIIHIDEHGNQADRAAGIAILIDNIHTALQTATMIEMCRIAARNFWIAIVAAIIAGLSAVAAWVAVFIYN